LIRSHHSTFSRKVTLSVYQSRKALTSANLNDIRLQVTVFAYRAEENGRKSQGASPMGASTVDMVEISHREPAPAEDTALLALEERFNVLVAELATVQETNPRSSDSRSFGPDVELLHDRIGFEAQTRQLEAILTSLCPIERAIMQTPARTIAGLGVKARHAAYVMSHYWEAPIDRIDWDARAVRLLIEAICDVAGTPLSLCNLRGGE
jgi:hypothetical protein